MTKTPKTLVAAALVVMALPLASCAKAQGSDAVLTPYTPPANTSSSAAAASAGATGATSGAAASSAGAAPAPSSAAPTTATPPAATSATPAGTAAPQQAPASTPPANRTQPPAAPVGPAAGAPKVTAPDTKAALIIPQWANSFQPQGTLIGTITDANFSVKFYQSDVATATIDVTPIPGTTAIKSISKGEKYVRLYRTVTNVSQGPINVSNQFTISKVTFDSPTGPTALANVDLNELGEAFTATFSMNNAKQPYRPPYVLQPGETMMNGTTFFYKPGAKVFVTNETQTTTAEGVDSGAKPLTSSGTITFK